MLWATVRDFGSTLYAAELDGVDDDDPIALGSNQFFGAELAKDAYHNLTNRADRVGQIPLAHEDAQFTVCRHALRCQVEQVPGNPLANRRECATRNLGDEALHPVAELGEQDAGDSYVRPGQATRHRG